MPRPEPYRVLFVCTGNSARSQIAEALVNARGSRRFIAESAGSHPAQRVNPWAIQVLADAGIPWRGHPPRGFDGLTDQPWDFVITVCDHAKESCPIFPGHPVASHWGMPDPAAVEGTDDAKRGAFRATLAVLERRVGALVALPVDELTEQQLRERVRAIGNLD